MVFSVRFPVIVWMVLNTFRMDNQSGKFCNNSVSSSPPLIGRDPSPVGGAA